MRLTIVGPAGARPAGPTVCRCSRTHHPDPTELHGHHVRPLYLGGDDSPVNLIWLCPTGHANVHEMIRLMMKVGRLTHGEMRAHFPERLNAYLYRVAVEGYDAWRASQSL
jgi:hypothetical protein